MFHTTVSFLPYSSFFFVDRFDLTVVDVPHFTSPYTLVQVRSASEWIVDKLFASEETKTKFVVFAHHKIVIDRLQEASTRLFGFVGTEHGVAGAVAA